MSYRYWTENLAVAEVVKTFGLHMHLEYQHAAPASEASASPQEE